MCATLTATAAALCDKYRAVPQQLTPARLSMYLAAGRISQAEYNSIIDLDCPCGWIEPATMAAPAEAAPAE